MNICFSWSGHKWLGKAFAWAHLRNKICYWLLPKLLILFCSCHPDWLLRNDIFVIDSFFFQKVAIRQRKKNKKLSCLRNRRKKEKKTAWRANNDSITHVRIYNNLSHIGRLICTQEHWKLSYEHRTMSVCRPWPYFETVGIRNVSENLSSVMWAKLGCKMHNT